MFKEDPLSLVSSGPKGWFCAGMRLPWVAGPLCRFLHNALAPLKVERDSLHVNLAGRLEDRMYDSLSRCLTLRIACFSRRGAFMDPLSGLLTDLATNWTLLVVHLYEDSSLPGR